MRSCGIIAEYNPFHNGHRYQLVEARKKSQSEVMIIAMSGNFLQRGEPAILDKWVRTRIALQQGADLVVEQSVLGSVQATDLFAKAGIRLLSALQCDSFSFGAEEGTVDDFTHLAALSLQKKAEINQFFQTFRNDGRSYPVQIEEALRRAAGETALPFDLSLPNNQLGLAYMRENLKETQPMEAFIIPRKGAQHWEEDADTAEVYASGTAIRKLLQQSACSTPSELEKWVPHETVAAVRAGSVRSWESYWNFLRYRIVTASPEELREYYQIVEGIEFRLKKFALSSETFTAFIQAVKNKRWTWTRLQRVCLYLLLGIRQREVEHFFSQPPVIRILGFTEAGSRYLRKLKKRSDVVLLSNVNQQNREKISTELRSDEVYSLGNSFHLEEQNYTRAPIRM